MCRELTEQYFDTKDKPDAFEQLKKEYEAECRRSDELEDSLKISWKNEEKLKNLLKECKNEFKYLRKHCDSRWKNNPLLEERIDEVLK